MNEERTSATPPRIRPGDLVRLQPGSEWLCVRCVNQDPDHPALWWIEVWDGTEHSRDQNAQIPVM